MNNETREKMTDRLVGKQVKRKVTKEVPQPKTLPELAEERRRERALEKVAPNTGYETLDRYIKGWIPGHLYVLTGETNAGKTAAACNFSHRVAKQNKKVLYFALEPDVGVIEYMASIYHRKTWDKIEDKDLDIELPQMTVYTKETHSTLDQLLATIESMDRQDLVIIDHIGYFTNNPSDKRSQVQQESDAIKRIIGTAKKKKSAIMIIAHPRKGAGKNRKNDPLMMNDISGSAAFKQDATDILILHRQKAESDKFNLTDLPDGFLLLPKIKTGMTGSVKIRFIPNSAMMQDESEILSTSGINKQAQEALDIFR